MWGAITAAVVAVTVLLAVEGKQVDRRAVVRENQRILAALPKPPGARVVARLSLPVRVEARGRIVGYSTRWDLTLRRPAPASTLEAFYRRRLSARWRLVERLAGPVLTFRRGRRLLSVNLENAGLQRLELAVVRGAALGPAG